MVKTAISSAMGVGKSQKASELRRSWPGGSSALLVDPLGFDAGDSNLYRYVNNGPANSTDPTGLQAWDRESGTLQDLPNSDNIAIPGGKAKLSVFTDAKLKIKGKQIPKSWIVFELSTTKGSLKDCHFLQMTWRYEKFFNGSERKGSFYIIRQGDKVYSEWGKRGRMVDAGKHPSTTDEAVAYYDVAGEKTGDTIRKDGFLSIADSPSPALKVSSNLISMGIGSAGGISAGLSPNPIGALGVLLGDSARRKEAAVVFDTYLVCGGKVKYLVQWQLISKLENGKWDTKYSVTGKATDAFCLKIGLQSCMEGTWMETRLHISTQCPKVIGDQASGKTSTSKPLLVGIGLIVLCCTTFGLLSIQSNDPINPTNFEKIKKGMTESDVIRILGRKPDDCAWCDVWIGQDSLIFVRFDENQLVIGSGYKAPLPKSLQRSTLFDRIKKWLLWAEQRREDT